MVSINHSDIGHLARYYRNEPSDWLTLPNICDPIDFLGLGPRAAHLFTRFDLGRRDVVQIFPASTPRTESKGITRILDAFKQLKLLGRSVALIVVNAHANGADGIAAKKRVADYAQQLDLLPDEEIIWTSDVFPETIALGLPRHEVAELMRVGNVFMFPSVSEACGLIMLEAALSGQMLILNQSLAVLTDFIPHDLTWYVRWGSVREPQADAIVAAKQAAELIDRELTSNVILKVRRRILADFGIETLAETMRRLLS